MEYINLMDLEFIEETTVSSGMVVAGGGICGLFCKGGACCGIWCWP
ncbi:MAG: hypothetical protein RMK99_02185 [Anaerolineales bacterium]|nr:hypothetical protein [Anaerolineales bacterium]